MELDMMGSRPVVGSSNSTIFGSVMRARAKATLLFIPPLISAGYFVSIPLRPTSSSACITLSLTSSFPSLRLFAQGKGDVAKDGQGVEECALLEYDAEFRPHLIEFPAAGPGDIQALDEYCPLIGFEDTYEMLEKNALAASASPNYRRQLFVADPEVQPVQDGLFTEGFSEVADLDHFASASVQHRSKEVIPDEDKD